jgi:hypothetical protein
VEVFSNSRIKMMELGILVTVHVIVILYCDLNFIIKIIYTTLRNPFK